MIPLQVNHKNLHDRPDSVTFPPMILRFRLIPVAVILLFALLPVTADATSLAEFFGIKTEKRLEFFNTHTRETMAVSYWRNGGYDHNAMEEVNHYLRDHRSGHVHSMSKDLLNLLYDIRTELSYRHPDKDIIFHVISGYRSPQTNEMLRANGGGQAKKSRHMHGDAIDIRVPGIDSKEIRDVAWCLQQGGVGYYSGSDFVHVDTWKVRHWHWQPKAGMCNKANS